MRALIIETAFLGDVIISLALAEELKRLEPNAEITYLVRPESTEILSIAPAVDEAIIYDKRGKDRGSSGIKRISNELNEKHFDTLFLLHQSTRSRRLAALLNIPTKIGFASEPKPYLTHIVGEPRVKQRTERAVALASALYNDLNYGTLPKLDPSTTKDIPAKPYIVLAPGSAWNTKKWGTEKFAELNELLTGDGYVTVLIGGPGDEDECGEIAGVSDAGSCINLAGHISLSEAAAVIKGAEVLVANDSAPVHIATAVRTKSIVIYGPTVPEFGFAPPEVFGEIVQLDALWCRPCTPHGSDTCPLYHHACMKELSVDRVFAAVSNSLKHSKASVH